MSTAGSSRIWKKTTLTFMAFVSFCASLESLGQEPAKEHPESHLTVKISANKDVIRPGESLRLVVEIRNESEQAFFIDRNITDMNDRLSLYLQHGSEVDRSSIRVVGDFAIDRRTPLATLLSQHWIALGPGNFYGGEVVMDGVAFPRLRVPGRYLVKAVYSSHGFAEPGEANSLRDRQEELRSLPFKAWEGRIETNSIWIEVAE